jgi:hypothetical protein
MIVIRRHGIGFYVLCDNDKTLLSPIALSKIRVQRLITGRFIHPVYLYPFTKKSASLSKITSVLKP